MNLDLNNEHYYSDMSLEEEHTMHFKVEINRGNIDLGIETSEAEESEDRNFLTGKFRCNPGFILSGPSSLKCRGGTWSGNLPVCTGKYSSILS